MSESNKSEIEEVWGCHITIKGLVFKKFTPEDLKNITEFVLCHFYCVDEKEIRYSENSRLIRIEIIEI